MKAAQSTTPMSRLYSTPGDENPPLVPTNDSP